MFSKLVDEDPGPSPNIDREGAQKHNNKRFFRSFALVLGTFGVSLGLTYWRGGVRVKSSVRSFVHPAARVKLSLTSTLFQASRSQCLRGVDHGCTTAEPP